MLAQSAPSCIPGKRLDFDAASFEEKKLIAAQFIDRILLDDNRVNIIWKI